MQMSLEKRFSAILMLSADSPEKLRALDVDRVMEEAEGQGIQNEFATWLLAQELQPRTREEMEAWQQDREVHA